MRTKRSRWIGGLMLISTLGIILIQEVSAATIAGIVDSVTPTTISMKTAKGKVETFRVAQDVRITLNGQRVPLTDLKSGDLAAVVTEIRPQGSVVVNITARSV